MARDKVTFTAVVLVAIVAIVGMIGLMGYGGAPQFTGAATSNGTAQIGIQQLACLTLDDASINFGSGAVAANSNYAEVYSNNSATYNGTWSAVNDPFNLRNCGNNNLTVTTKINDTDFVGGNSTFSKVWYRWSDDESPGESGTCYQAAVTENAWHEYIASNTDYGIGNITYGTSNDELRIDMRLRIPYDAPQGTKTAKVTFTGTAI